MYIVVIIDLYYPDMYLVELSKETDKNVGIENVVWTCYFPKSLDVEHCLGVTLVFCYSCFSVIWIILYMTWAMSGDGECKFPTNTTRNKTLCSLAVDWSGKKTQDKWRCLEGSQEIEHLRELITKPCQTNGMTFSKSLEAIDLEDDRF